MACRGGSGDEVKNEVRRNDKRASQGKGSYILKGLI